MLYTIIFTLLAALAVSLIFTLIFRNPGPWNSFWVFLGIIFLSMFAFSLWVTPIGPIWHDIAWFDTLLIGLLLALLLGAASEPYRENYPVDKKGEVDLVAGEQAEPGTGALFGVFFWIFIITMVALTIAGIIRAFQVL